jgi:hypothetical protein
MAQMQEHRKANFLRDSRLIKECFRCAVRGTVVACNLFCQPSHLLRKAFLPLCLCLTSLLSITGSVNAQVEGPLRLQPQPTDQSVQNAAQNAAQDSPPVVEQSRDSVFMEAINGPLGWPKPEPAMPELPAQVAIPMDRPIRVALDTPLSTRISKQGEIVAFRITYSILLGDDLEVPPNTEILGHVTEVKKPASFGKNGVLRVAVDRIRLDPDGGANLKAHVDSAEMKGQSRTVADKRRPTDLYNVMVGSAGGAILGAVIGGAKGAAIGAGTGAGTAVLIKMAHRGDDVYLEPGMLFSVVLDQPVYLSGPAVYAAQQKFKQNPRSSPTIEPDSHDSSPKLKRRPPPQN